MNALMYTLSLENHKIGTRRRETNNMEDSEKKRKQMPTEHILVPQYFGIGMNVEKSMN